MSCAEDKTLSAAIIAGPSVNLLAPTKVLITWETDIPGNSTVEYGLDTNLDSIFVDDEERQSHAVILSDLDFNTTYYYRISSISSSFDTEVSSKIDTFTTGENAISIVTGPLVEFINPTEVVITWDTDTPGNSIVEYSTNNNLDSSYIDNEEVQFHSVSLTNLMPDTIYYYRVTSISSVLNTQVSSTIDTFTTIEGIISIISPPVVDPISPFEVQITWDTDVSGNSIVDYGMTSDLGEQIVDSQEQLSHSIVLTALTPDTQYYYRVTSISSVLNAQVSSTIDTFTTIEGTISIISLPVVELISPLEVQITWDTDIIGNSIVDYGLTTDLGLQVMDSEEELSHSIVLTDLTPDTQYYYRVTSISSGLNAQVSSAIDTFTTNEGVISILSPPVIEHISPVEVQITWDTDVSGNSIVDYGMTSDLGEQVVDSEEQLSHSIVLTDLTPDTQYYYRVTSVSSALNAQVSSAIDTFTTNEGIISIISPPVVELISPVEVQITWDTDVTGNSIVDYGLTTDLGSQVMDSEEELSHSVVLTDLTPDTQYYYRVTSISSGLNAQVSSAIDSFTTSTGEINIVMGPTVEVVSSTEVLITWDTDIIGNSIIDYNTTTNLDSQVVDLTEQLSHSIMLTDLAADSTYYYQVTSVSSALNVQVSSEIDTFVTSGFW